MFSFRLHEFDEQVAAVREGMARVVPVPLLSLFTGYELETMVCPPLHCASLQRPSRGNPLNQHHVSLSVKPRSWRSEICSCLFSEVRHAQEASVRCLPLLPSSLPHLTLPTPALVESCGVLM